jgi:Flp pilus assembly protein TadD
MFAVLLLTTLLAAADPQADKAPTPQPEDLAQAGNYKAALEGFRRRVSADPGDLDARVWIAWLHERMGRPDLAEPVYRSVVLEAPGHVDAAIRFATLLMKQRHNDEAVRVLERAKGAEPRNPELLAALGSAHLRVSNASLALAYLELAAALSPTPENVNALKRARRAHRSSPPRSADVVGAGG